MDYLKILQQASKKGMEAFNKCTPTPVQWVSVDIMDKPISEPSEIDNEGECGGAYITGLDGRSDFVKWMKQMEHTSALQKFVTLSKGVYKGYDLFLHIENYNGQSKEKREAFANSFCSVLLENRIYCAVKSYLS